MFKNKLQVTFLVFLLPIIIYWISLILIDSPIYLRPWVTKINLFMMLIDFVIIPIIYGFKKIKLETTLLDTLPFVFMMIGCIIFYIVIFSFNVWLTPCLNTQYQKPYLYTEEKVWLESNSWTTKYQINDLFTMKFVENYSN